MKFIHSFIYSNSHSDIYSTSPLWQAHWTLATELRTRQTFLTKPLTESIHHALLLLLSLFLPQILPAFKTQADFSPPPALPGSFPNKFQHLFTLSLEAVLGGSPSWNLTFDQPASAGPLSSLFDFAHVQSH